MAHTKTAVVSVAEANAESEDAPSHDENSNEVEFLEVRKKRMKTCSSGEQEDSAEESSTGDENTTEDQFDTTLDYIPLPPPADQGNVMQEQPQHHEDAS